MLHFTCDLCGRELRPGEDQRFVVKMEAYAAHDPAELTEEDLDEDHMEAISQLLREDNGDDTELAASRRNFRYDFCPECHQKFLRDPLGRDGVQKFDFSKN
jgi:hypothetical protein